MDKKLFRIIDVNLNRSREGLRVIEDIARFYLDNKNLTGILKGIRHQIANTVKDADLFLLNRQSDSDVGRRFEPLLEGNKKDIKELVISNFRRVEESLRVLEDVSKIIMPKKADVYKKLRFRVYTLEKRIYETVCNTR